YSLLDARALSQASLQAQQYAELRTQFYARVPPRPGYRNMSRIQAPFFANSGLLMPGCAFALVRADAPTPAAFFENALDIVLRRPYPRVDALAGARERLATTVPWRDVAVVLARMLCLFSNYCVYLMDKVVEGSRGTLSALFMRPHERFIESFDVTPRTTLTGD